MAASPEAKFTEETVLWVKHHTPKLITFCISRPESYRFAGGQFSRLGFHEGEGYIWRAYSVVSAEYADTLEYFAVLIRAHRSRINVDVGIKFLNCYLQSAILEQAAERCRSNALAER